MLVEKEPPDRVGRRAIRAGRQPNRAGRFPGTSRRGREKAWNQPVRDAWSADRGTGMAGIYGEYAETLQ